MDPERRFFVSQIKEQVYCKILSTLWEFGSVELKWIFYIHVVFYEILMAGIPCDLSLSVTKSLICSFSFCNLVTLSLVGLFQWQLLEFSVWEVIYCKTSCIFWLCVYFSSQSGGLTCWSLNMDEHQNHLDMCQKHSSGDTSLPSFPHTLTLSVWVKSGRLLLTRTSEPSSKPVFLDKVVEEKQVNRNS